TVIAILAFAAIGLSQDDTGEFCLSLFQVMLFSLTLSWIIAVTITPLLCYWLLPGPAAEGAAPTALKDVYGGPLFSRYRRLLEACLRRRWLTLGVMAALLAAAVYGFFQVQGSFFPKSTMSKFMIHYWLPEGTDIRKTFADVQVLEQAVLADDRVDSVASFIGAGAPRFILTYSPEKTNDSYAFLLVSVNDYREIDSLMDTFRVYLAEHFPDAEPKLQRFNLGPSPDSSFEVRISGPDPQVLRTLSERVKVLLYASQAVEIRDDWRQRVKVVRPLYAERQAQFAGVDRTDLNEALQTNFSGLLVGVYRENDELIPIYSRAPAAERLDASQIGNVQVWSPVLQSAIQIRQVVSGFSTGWEDAQIHRFDRKRAITVGAEPPPGQLPSELFERLRPAIETLSLPLGYSIAWGGEHDAATDAQKGLAAGIPVAMGLMVLITVVLFNSLRHPLIIWLTVPLAFIGVSAGLLASGEPFGFMPLLGFLSLSGMLIKNAIVLIDQINLTRAQVDDAWEAVIEASVSRCRPVLMAAGTTVLGMLPLLRDDFFVGMAVTIMAGLSFASVLTLVVVPVLYTVVFNICRPQAG
ncbi:efflux RND transporter permease subunit, partial [Exilibacterium tricleocarpae]